MHNEGAGVPMQCVGYPVEVVQYASADAVLVVDLVGADGKPQGQLLLQSPPPPRVVQHCLCEQMPNLISQCPMYRKSVNPQLFLPDDVMLRILRGLPRQDLLSMGFQSSRWHRLAGDPSLWRDVQISLDNRLHVSDISLLMQARKFGWHLPDLSIVLYHGDDGDAVPSDVREATIWQQPRKLLHWGGNHSREPLFPSFTRLLSPFLVELEWMSSYTILVDAALAEVYAMPALRRLTLVLDERETPGRAAYLLPRLPPQLDWLSLRLSEPSLEVLHMLGQLTTLRDLVVRYGPLMSNEALVAPLPPNLEALTLVSPWPHHLYALAGMPRLRKLILVGAPPACKWLAPSGLEELGLYETVPALAGLRGCPRLRHLAVHPLGWDRVQPSLPAPTALLPPAMPALQWLSITPPGYHGDDALDRDLKLSRRVMLSFLRLFEHRLQNLRMPCFTYYPSQYKSLAGLVRLCVFSEDLKQVLVVRELHDEGHEEHHREHVKCETELRYVDSALGRPSAAVLCSACLKGRTFSEHLDRRHVWGWKAWFL